MFKIISMKGPTFTVRLTVEVNFYAYRRFARVELSGNKDGEVFAFEKFSLKFRSFIFRVKADIYRSFWKVLKLE